MRQSGFPEVDGECHRGPQGPFFLRLKVFLAEKTVPYAIVFALKNRNHFPREPAEGPAKKIVLIQDFRPAGMRDDIRELQAAEVYGLRFDLEPPVLPSSARLPP